MKKTIETILSVVVVISLLLGFVFMIWLTSKPLTKMTACGWEREDSEDVWVCREYRQINYELGE